MDNTNTNEVTDTRPGKRVQDAMRTHVPAAELGDALDSAESWAASSYADNTFRLYKRTVCESDPGCRDRRGNPYRVYYYRGYTFERNDGVTAGYGDAWSGRGVSEGSHADCVRYVDERKAAATAS